MQTHPHDALDLQHGVTALHASAMVVEGGGADGDAAECKWGGTARERERAEAPLQPARPTYDPRARQMRDPPPVKTSRYQWYITPGEAV